MHVTVFGASGAIGRHVVGGLLDDGHHVTAFVRSPTRLGRHHQRLRLAVAQLDDADAVAAAVGDAGAVVSALGPPLRHRPPGTPVADGTASILAAMRLTGVRRFVGLATPSVPDVRDRRSLRTRTVPLVAGTLFPQAQREVRTMTRRVVCSELDWTVARITRPTDGPPTGRVRAGFLGVDPVGSTITRADVGRFLADQVDDATYLRALPAISN